MPGRWKTNGSGSVVNFPGQTGRMQLRNFTSYKLKSNESLPENFTIEFDIVTDSETDVSAFGSLAFGFAHNNNISNFIGDAYNDGAITNTKVFYANGEINSMSSDTQVNNNTDFPLQGYAIGKMHVAIAVHGNNMQVFLDRTKVMDARMFSRPDEARYFYISTATNMNNNARIAVGNFKIAS